jgi:hypothetical protein
VEKSRGVTAIIGIVFAYITLATTDAKEKNESTPVVRMAAGAVSARIASNNTAVVVEEPRVNGTARMHPLAIWPDRGWRRSIISPV